MPELWQLYIFSKLQAADKFTIKMLFLLQLEPWLLDHFEPQCKILVYVQLYIHPNTSAPSLAI